MSEESAQPAQENVKTIAQLERQAMSNRSLAERISDALTKAAGSLTSIALHLAWFTIWIVLNLGLVPGIKPFDPFPFGILTLIVSTEGVFLALTILVSQNRVIRHADRRAQLDLQISLLAEQETTLVLHVLQRIARRLDIPEDVSENKLAQRTDINAMVRSLDKELPKE